MGLTQRDRNGRTAAAFMAALMSALNSRSLRLHARSSPGRTSHRSRGMARTTPRALARDLSPSRLPSSAEIATAGTRTVSSDDSIDENMTLAEADGRLLFDADAHVPAWRPSLLAYAPLGLVLAVLRMALWIGGVLLDAPWFRRPEVVGSYLAMLVRGHGGRGNWVRPTRQQC